MYAPNGRSSRDAGVSVRMFSRIHSMRFANACQWARARVPPTRTMLYCVTDAQRLATNGRCHLVILPAVTWRSADTASTDAVTAVNNRVLLHGSVTRRRWDTRESSQNARQKESSLKVGVRPESSRTHWAKMRGVTLSQ